MVSVQQSSEIIALCKESKKKKKRKKKKTLKGNREI